MALPKFIEPMPVTILDSALRQFLKGSTNYPHEWLPITWVYVITDYAGEVRFMETYSRIFQNWDDI